MINLDGEMIYEEHNLSESGIVNRMNVPTKEMINDDGKLLCM